MTLHLGLWDGFGVPSPGCRPFVAPQSCLSRGSGFRVPGLGSWSVSDEGEGPFSG